SGVPLDHRTLSREPPELKLHGALPVVLEALRFRRGRRRREPSGRDELRPENAAGRIGKDLARRIGERACVCVGERLVEGRQSAGPELRSCKRSSASVRSGSAMPTIAPNSAFRPRGSAVRSKKPASASTSPNASVQARAAASNCAGSPERKKAESGSNTAR